MKRYLLFAYLFIILVLMIPWTQWNQSLSDLKNDLRVMAILPLENNPFWKGVWNGIRESAQEASFLLSEYEFSDTQEAIQLLDIATKTDIDGLLLAPKVSLDQTFYEKLGQLRDKGVKVAILDTDIEAEYYDAFVGIDNSEAGTVLGEYLVSKLQPEQKILEIHGISPLSNNMQERIDAFHSVMEREGIRSQIETLEAASGYLQGTQNILKILQQSDDFMYLVAVGPGYTLYAASAVVMAEMSDKLDVIGFGETEEALQYVEHGVIEALFVQANTQLGKKGVQIMEQLLLGEKTEKRYDIDINLVTAENVQNYME